MMNGNLWPASVMLALALLVGCSGERETQKPAPEGAAKIELTPTRNAYFGDLHLHTALSLDAFITNTRTLPEDAYRYARGEPIDHVSGKKIQIHTPLDFLAVTDHAELIGVAVAMNDPSNPLSRTELAPDITSTDYERSHAAFRRIVEMANAGAKFGSLIDRVRAGMAMKDAWQRVVEAAEKYYEPGKFTTFVAYEWTSMPNAANLHRNVVFSGTDVPDMPFSSADSVRPEDLWDYLDEWRTEHADVLAIPHNSNASKGLMFPLVDSFGNPVDADYAARRTRNEPLVEITQVKGTSETTPLLSPNDEFADFELWHTVVGGTAPVPEVPGSYVRTALQRGLEFEARGGFNPFKFGIVGASDSHDSSTAVEEFNFTGGHGNADATPEIRLDSKPSTLVTSSLNFSASGLTGVWAEANTREAIFAAMKRRETFGTSGTRITLRFFAAGDFGSNAPSVEQAYERGVSMGGDLKLATSKVPEFFFWAVRDPDSAPLDRVQIVKGWVQDGQSHEAVIDVACAGREPVDGHCAPSGADVDLTSCAPRGDGAGELTGVWQDPAFDGRAVYYLRVLENPTCRWSTWDALRLGRTPPDSVPTTIVERAWSSPIWVSGGGTG